MRGKVENWMACEFRLEGQGFLCQSCWHQTKQEAQGSRLPMSQQVTITMNQALDLIKEFKAHPDLCWELPNTGCEARADMMAEIAHDKGYEPIKIWMFPYSDATLQAFTNKAKTESVTWSFHVAIFLNVLVSDTERQLVIDPTLYDEPVESEVWYATLSSNPEGMFSHLGDYKSYFGYTDMLIEGYRDKALAAREKTLKGLFDLTDPVVFEGWMKNRRGRMIDEVMENDPSAFKQIREEKDYFQFGLFFQAPMMPDRFRDMLESYSSFYAIPSNELLDVLDFEDPFVYLQFVEKYWRDVARVLSCLRAEVDRLRDDPEKGSRFELVWDDDDDELSTRWFHPTAQDLWHEWGVDIAALRA